MFRLFEKSLPPTSLPARTEPPPGLIAFYWHFARQARGLFLALFAAGFAVALLDVTIPVFIGKVVTLVTTTKPEALSRSIGRCSRAWLRCCCSRARPPSPSSIC